jgi:broad specificity phosphatase PhoE
MTAPATSTSDTSKAASKEEKLQESLAEYRALRERVRAEWDAMTEDEKADYREETYGDRYSTYKYIY